MPTKPSDLFQRIPSVTELLEKPPVRALADRWSRSTVAAGVRTFLDELRSDLQRRATNVGMPSARELAERAARYVIALQEHFDRPAINATGRIYGAPFASGPLDDVALERMVAFGREFVVGPSQPIPGDSLALSADLVSTACRLTGAQAATAVHSYAGALWLTLASIAARGEIVVGRSQMGDVEPGCGLADLAASSGAVLREVGATNRTRLSDYEAALTDGAAAVIRIWSDGYSIVGESETVEIESLVPLAREQGALVIDAVGGSPLVDLPMLGDAARCSVRTSLGHGADLVIVRGDGLIGGPPSAMLLGQRQSVDPITSHPMFAPWRLDPLNSAALTGTLAAIEAKPNSEPALLLLELLGASMENLRNRAERISPQLAQAPGIASAEAIATRSRLFPAQAEAAGLASHAVSLSPIGGDAKALQRRLASAPQSVVGRVEGNRVILDLRTVFPRQDQALVNAIAARGPDTPSEPATR